MADSPQKTKKSQSKAGRAAELLGDWRAAERDEVVAITAAKVAGRALEAALAAEHAALVAEKSAKAAADAVRLALQAADNARKAALAAKEVTNLLTAEAEGDKVRATHVVEVAEKAVEEAGDRFHEGKRDDFKSDDD